ncbi:MAG: hypothetical protein GC165_08875 [Armatimonadetes bacterium]|nr:hypothetical protein [Armatimonadota bacterium]
MFNGLFVVLDKSAFQMLSKDEVFVCSCCFSPIVCPILPAEILADLDKLGGEKTISMGSLCEKLQSLHGIYNAESRGLILNSLMGRDYSGSRRPVVDHQQTYYDEDGVRGDFVGGHPIELALLYWEQGQFLKSEQELSKLWRITFQDEQALALEELVRKERIIIEFVKDKRKIHGVAEQYANKPSLKSTWLAYLLTIAGGNREQVSVILERFADHAGYSIRILSPYAYFVLKLHLSYLILVRSKHSSSQPTHVLDLNYLEYCPFTHIFVSNDRFHKRMAETGVLDGTLFLSGNQFKAELQNISRTFRPSNGSGFKVETFSNEEIRSLVRSNFKQTNTKEGRKDLTSIDLIRERLGELMRIAEEKERKFIEQRSAQLQKEGEQGD